MAIARKTFSDYLEDAKEMASEVSKVTDRIERERMIPPEITNQMKDRGLFRLLIPRSLEGAELDHPSFLRLVFEFGKADASVGWCFNQNNVFATNSTRLPEKASREIWTDWRNVVTNGPPTRDTLATPVDGGYRLTGRWNFSSGSPHATWLAALTPINRGPGDRSHSSRRSGRDVNLHDSNERSRPGDAPRHGNCPAADWSGGGHLGRGAGLPS